MSTPETVAALVFDMDGLLLDTEPLYKVAWQKASAELGHDLDDHSYAKLVGRSSEDCERELLTQFGSGFELDRFRGRWPELWHEQVAARGIQQKPGVLAILSYLDDQKIPAAVATSSTAGYAQFSLEHAGLDGRFRVIVTSDEVEHGKPASDIYLETARRLGVAPRTCIALEDSEAGALAAHRAGMRVLLIPDGARPSEAGAELALRVCDDLDDARYIVAGLIARGASNAV